MIKRLVFLLFLAGGLTAGWQARKQYLQHRLLLQKIAGVTASGSSLYFIHQDQLGSTSLITDASGAAVARQTYYPYGTTRATEGSLPTEKQYTGQVSDTDETGLYYYNARYYNPAIAKFTQADSAADELNRYAYVANNPINRTDPTGNSSQIPDPQDFNDSNSSGYSHLVFQRMLEHAINLNPDWANQSDIEKINYLSNYINNKIPYSTKLIKVWDREDALRSSIESANNLYLNPPLTENGSLDAYKYLELSYTGRLKQEQLELIFLAQEDTLWNQKSTSPLEQYKNDLFICYNFADLLSEWIQTALPDIPVYAGGISGHAFDFFEYENQLYTVDPTWGWEAQTLANDMRSRSYFNWVGAGYNPNASSLLADPDFFNQSIFYSLKVLSRQQPSHPAIAY